MPILCKNSCFEYLLQLLCTQMEDSTVIVKSENKPSKNKVGRPLKVISKEMRIAAIQYVTDSGISMESLANFLGIARSTLQDIFKRDKEFSAEIHAGNAEFRRKIVMAARPEFILRNKFRDEFPDTKIEPENDTDKRLKEFLDRAAYLGNTRRRELDSQPTQE